MQLGTFSSCKTGNMNMGVQNFQSFYGFKNTQKGNSGFYYEPTCKRQVNFCFSPLKTQNVTVLHEPRWSKQSLYSFKPLKNQDYGKFEVGFLRKVERRQKLLTVSVKSVMDVSKVVENDEVTVGKSKGVYDAIVIGSGIGGLVAATQLAVKGAKVLVLEKYVIPGGSSGFYERDGYTFDVGSSVMFGFSDKGNLNLITQALAAVGCKMEVIPDPTTVHFHLPNSLSVQVHREYNDFVSELTSKFPHEKEGILKFYDVCWKIFNALNSLELKSLEEPLYLFGQFFKKPVECLTLAYYLPQNAGTIARNFIKDPEVLSFIDAECFIVSTVNALQTPMINASMVLCDRHFGGINYPVGGVGGIAKSLAKGLVDYGSEILYKANVTSIIIDNEKAVGVKLSDGREFFAKTIISNATRWDTFGKLLKKHDLPKEEENFQKVYVKAPSFLSIHMGVKAEVLPPDTDCHHFVLEDDWKNLEEPYGSIFLSIPTILDSSLAPKGRHILHIFTTSSIEDWQVAKHTNAQDVWKAIKVRCLGTERVQKARLQTLKGKMEKLKMKEGETINDFEGKMGSIVERFKCLGMCVDEEETVRKFLNSVTKKYLPIVSSIEQYGDIENMPLVEAVGRLKAYEDRLDGFEEKEENQGQLLLTNGESDGKRYGRGRGRGSGFGRGERGRGRGRFDKSKFRCYECGEFGHFANECTKWKGKEEANLIDLDEEPALA